jgi:hypothetical protein
VVLEKIMKKIKIGVKAQLKKTQEIGTISVILPSGKFLLSWLDGTCFAKIVSEKEIRIL